MRKITTVTRKEPKLIKYRSLKHHNPIKFGEDLLNTDWTRILGLKDIHQCSREWERKSVDLLNKHAPFKHRNVRNTYAPYIDNELKQKMFCGDLFKKKHSKYKDPNDWTQYKRIKNELNVELKNKIKALLFSEKLEHSMGDSKEIWKILNSALGRRSKTTYINSLVSDKGDEVTCPNELSNILNNHFATITDKVPIESETDYHKLDNGDFQQWSILSPLDYVSKIRYDGTLFQSIRITADDILRNAVENQEL